MRRRHSLALKACRAEPVTYIMEPSLCCHSNGCLIGQHSKTCCACFAGLLLSSLALHMAAPAQRFVPEALTFASTLLATAAPLPATAVAQAQHWLVPGDDWSSLSAPTPALNLVQVLQSPPDDAAFAADSFRGSLLQAALGVVDRAADVFARLPSFSELFASASGTLSVLRNRKGMPEVGQNPSVGVAQGHFALHA